MYDIKNCLQGPICIIRFLFCLRKYFRIISERNGFILDQSALEKNHKTENRRKSKKSPKLLCLKICPNENFIMQLAYGDKILLYKLCWFIIEKFDLLVERPPEKEVLWFFSRRLGFWYYTFLISNSPLIVLTGDMHPSTLKLGLTPPLFSSQQ